MLYYLHEICLVYKCIVNVQFRPVPPTLPLYWHPHIQTHNTCIAFHLDCVGNYSKTVSFRFHQTVLQPQLVVWAGLPSLEPGFSYSSATSADQGSELLLFLLYNDISCKSEVMWVVFEVSHHELNEQPPTATQKCADLTCMYMLYCYVHCPGACMASELAKLEMLEHY